MAQLHKDRLQVPISDFTEDYMSANAKKLQRTLMEATGIEDAVVDAATAGAHAVYSDTYFRTEDISDSDCGRRAIKHAHHLSKVRML